jgi:2'-5' RNA ligase
VAVLRTALVVPVPAAAGAVDRWREATCAAKPSAGIPPHVTVAFPFVPPAASDDAFVDDLAELANGERAFAFELASFGRFPEVLYLAPSPAEPFVALKERVHGRYPGYPLYGDSERPFVPHLTVAQGETDLLDEAETAVRPFLPLESEARELLLLAETEPDWRRWEERATLPLRR